ncbi:hypothetical protein [Aquimarina sp. SS2-1]|uniref:hypothetical protein n=1 Tax=Aquimarina besae TaxID=3342247 RepID=UPI00367065BE
MKSSALTLIAICCIFYISQAQDTISSTPTTVKNDTFKNSIRILPLPILFGGIHFEYERTFSRDISLFIQFFGDFYNSNRVQHPSIKQGEIAKRNKVVSEIGVRYYISKRKTAPRGWFIGPGIICGYEHIYFQKSNTPNNEDYIAFLIGGSVKTGYQWIFKKGFTLGVVAGVDGIFKLKEFIEKFSARTLLEFSIGYSW